MSVEKHEAFVASVWRGEVSYHTTAYDQVEKVKKITDPGQLRAIAADKDLGVSVRKAAERRLRKLTRTANTDGHGRARTNTDNARTI